MAVYIVVQFYPKRVFEFPTIYTSIILGCCITSRLLLSHHKQNAAQKHAQTRRVTSHIRVREWLTYANYSKPHLIPPFFFQLAFYYFQNLNDIGPFRDAISSHSSPWYNTYITTGNKCIFAPEVPPPKTDRTRDSQKSCKATWTESKLNLVLWIFKMADGPNSENGRGEDPEDEVLWRAPLAWFPVIF